MVDQIRDRSMQQTAEGEHMAEQKCPICGTGTLNRKSIEFTAKIDNGRGGTKELRIPCVMADVCDNCGEEFLDPSSEDKITTAHWEFDD